MNIERIPTAPRIKTGLSFLMILSGLMAFTSLSTDIYLPAMPVMSDSLHGNAELTVTGFLLGFAIAQLFWGPVSDRLGRRKPLFMGMVLFVIGSIGCATSTGIGQIVFWRISQAIGACTGPMLARAMIRDLFTRTRAAQMLSTLIIIMAIAPIAGPLLGGQIIRFSHWQMIFWFMAVVGGVIFISLFWLPETLPPDKRSTSSLMVSMPVYLRLVKDKTYIRLTLCVSFFYVSVYAFIVGSPNVYIKYYGVDPQHYGWLFALNIMGVVAMSAVNKRLVQRVPLETLLRRSVLVSLMTTIIMCIILWRYPQALSLMVCCIFVFFSMNGIIAATATAAAMDAVPGFAGSASALIGSLQYGGGILSSMMLAWFNDSTPWVMVVIMLVFTLLSFVMAICKKVTPIHDDGV